MTIKRLQLVHLALFVSRCSGSATLSYWLTSVIGLQYPVWAAISAVVVSQVHLRDTQSSVSGRIVGTIIGVCIALAVNAATSILDVGIAVQITFSVAICAAIAWVFPRLRVCMWTSLIVLLSATQSIPMVTAGIDRGIEVILGSVVGGVLHFVADKILTVVELNLLETGEHKRTVSLSDE